MGFYGNIINYLTKGFKTVKTENGNISATTYDDEFTISGDTNFIQTSADNDRIKVTFLQETADSLYDISVIETSADNDNKYTFTIKQNDRSYDLTVPLIHILDKVELKTFDIINAPSGVIPDVPYFVFYFDSAETEREPIYVNVSDLNEIAGLSNDYITISVTNNQITADLTDNVKTKLSYIDINESISSSINTINNQMSTNQQLLQEGLNSTNSSVINLQQNVNDLIDETADIQNNLPRYSYDSESKKITLFNIVELKEEVE